MTNPGQLINVIEAKCRLLSQKNDEYPQLAENRAQCERDWKVLVREQVLRHKSDGHPATLIPTLVAGTKVVSDAKFAMDVSDAMVRANIESCRSTVNQIDSARSILSFLKQELGGR